MKNNKNLIIIGVLAAVLGLFLYLSKRKGNTKNAGENQDAPDSGGLTTRGQRNNNPFNIRYNKINKWKGLAGSDGSFCVFNDIKYGIRAGGVLLRGYLKNGANTIRKIISKFAPPSENNTESYIKHVAQMSGINDTQVLTDADLWRIARPMMYIESRYCATDADKDYFENKNI